ncbi:MAG TPA: sulfite exporter TauE/SafE family protein [Nocardioidaceae bacterium]|jgi:uncharacterized membrane protein YfcA|nr:sulfite exporter TauE/SafE family protein [Nocardioidaceae bacterium]
MSGTRAGRSTRLVAVMSLVGQSVALLAAGALAGAVGAAGGITSLVSYTALLAVGLPPQPAAVGNLVAAVALGPGSALTSRRELVNARRSLARGLPIAAAGATAGALLLLSTPAGVFSRVVPFLVATGALALLAQPWLTARVSAHQHRAAIVAWPLIGLVSIYLGYFAAGSGVMLLAVLLVLVEDRLPEANAVKNMLVGVGALASATVLALTGPVDWRVVAPLTIGLFAGSTAGPVIARAVPPTLVRWVVAALGFALAVELWLRA